MSGYLAAILALCMSLFSLLAADAAEQCSSHGALQDRFCDADGDLVADLPADPALWRDPQTLVWAYAPIEDPAVYANLFKTFTRHLESCLGRQIVYYPVLSTAAEIEALRSGRLHFAGFSTGPTVEAVNRAGAVPFAAKGVGGKLRGYRVLAIVRADSPYQNLADLAGRRVAHTSALSNSGHLAPQVFFPAQGLVPGENYVPLMSGGHDRSILGVLDGDYDMAAVASDVLERMIERGTVRRDTLRVIYESGLFPTSSFAHAHDLHPDLIAQMKSCFFNFTFTAEMQAEFGGDEHFLPIQYEQDWASVREVIEQANDPPPF